MIRIGIIGAGPNAAGHARYYRDLPRTQVVAIADLNEQRAKELASECGAEAMTDYRNFLDRVDAVVISSPNFLHREHAVTCAAAGRHIYCEKPVGLSLAEAEEIAAAVNAAHVKSTVGFSTRFDPGVQTMQRLIREGALGRMISLVARRLCWIDPAQAPAWRRDPRQSGGVLLEVNIHELDWLLALGGPVRSVFARFWAKDSTDPRANDFIWVTLQYAGGAVGLHEGSWLSSNPAFYRGVEGTEGAAMTNEWGNILYTAPRGGSRTETKPDPGFDIEGHFVDCIEHDAHPVADINWGLHVMRVAEAIYESAATNQVVALPEGA